MRHDRPAPHLPLFDAPLQRRPEDILLAFLAEAVKPRPHIYQGSAAEISARTGLSPSQVREARSRLVAWGLIAVDRPDGFAPRIAFVRWPGRPRRDQVCSPLVLDDHFRRINQDIETAFFELAQLARLFVEAGRDDEATRIAGVLQELRAAIRSLTPEVPAARAEAAGHG